MSVDWNSDLGKATARHLVEERIGWLTTVRADGAPQPTPIWYLWDGDATILMYSVADGQKLRNLRGNPRAALNLETYGRGGPVTIVFGDLRESPQEPPADQVAAFVDRYSDRMTRLYGSPSGYAQRYPTPLRLQITGLRGWGG